MGATRVYDGQSIWLHEVVNYAKGPNGLPYLERAPHRRRDPKHLSKDVKILKYHSNLRTRGPSRNTIYVATVRSTGTCPEDI